MNPITDIVDDLPLLLHVLPAEIDAYLKNHPKLTQLSEIVLDLGAYPEIRYGDSIEKLTNISRITAVDIQNVVDNIGFFNDDNRAGIERTLHRISAIRNRTGNIIGLTCRIGRAVVGTIEIIRDIIESGKNVLFLGPPGIGKTTKLREAARVLSDQHLRRVIIVDTSNEIAGDGDIPHPGIGSARRMQVPTPDQQHQVMIEAVENHAPKVIIVDEIGTKEEALAARTIAERGVQLVATAHGYTMENLIKNPTLSDLLGGIQPVILGDEQAKYRGSQKTVLERRSLPTFQILIEIRERDVFAIYHDVQTSVDALLRHMDHEPEVRSREPQLPLTIPNAIPQEHDMSQTLKTYIADQSPPQYTSIFPFGISSDRLYQAIHQLKIPAEISKSISQADLVLTVKSHMKSKSKISQIMQGRQIPLHVLKRGTNANIIQFFRHFFSLTETSEDLESEATQEIQTICKRVISEGRVVEAAPRVSFLRRLQHTIASQNALNSLSVGEEPNRRVRVYPRQ